MKTNKRNSIEPLEQRIAPALTSAAVSLGGITALTGASLGGAVDNDNLGTSVHEAGDVNGDGIGDFIVGAPFAGTGGLNQGAAYVVFGKDSGAPLNITPSSLNGSNGFAIFGAEDGSRFGSSVSSAGDVNGDGFGDIVIGAPKFNGSNVQRGAAYVVFGHGGSFGSSFNVSALDNTQAFSVEGAGTQDFLGTSVSNAGDVNGDGFGDIIVGSPNGNGDAADSGAAYILYGHSHFTGKIFTSILTATEGVKLGGIAANDKAGTSVSGGHDINGDGFDDVIVGAPLANEGGTNHGAAYVVFGKSNLALNTPLSGLGGTSGFRLSGVSDGDQAGFSVSLVGDLNGDGLSEIGVGAPLANEGGIDRGAAYVVFGKSANFSNPIALSGLDGHNGFKAVGNFANDFLGSSVSGAGDINGDGHADLIVGASGATVNGQITGSAYVLYGKAGDFAATRTLSSLDGQDGIRLPGLTAGSNTGVSVSAAGDVNHDGFGDVIVGSSFAPAGGLQRGDAHVVYGGPSGSANVAPVISADHKTATFTDVDGDLVTVKVSKGDLSTATFGLTGSTDHTSFQKLQLPASFAGANVSITAHPTEAGGDGHVNLGTFDATGVDLGKVSIAGNVERFTAGNANEPAPAVKNLTVGGLGAGALPLHDTFGDSYTSSLAGKTGPITVKGNLNSASLTVSGDLARLTIGGSLMGGETLFSGLVQTTSGGNIGPVKIAHNLVGGSGPGSGGINADGKLASVTIGGSQIGDSDVSGYLIAKGDLGKVKIGHDQHNGLVRSSGTLGSVTVGGSLILDNADALAGISGQNGVGSLLVKGDITGLADSPYKIEGGGLLTGDSSLAIGKVTVGGSVENAVILGGSLNDNGHAQIGTIKVGGNWTASSIAAGVQTSAASTNPLLFGNGDDTFLPGGPSSVVSQIASIVIKGAVNGTAADGDHFGFVAKQIGSLQVGAVKYDLAADGTADPIELGTTSDFTVRELA